MNELLPHLPRLRRYARALTGERFAADDLVQDTVERALSRFTLFRAGSKLDAWLLSIMHNLFVNQLRQRASRPAHDSLDEGSCEVPVPARATDGLEIRDLDRALAKLPPEQREVLLLVALEDLSYEETARIVGVPIGTVMSRLSRGRERLRALLAGETPVAAHLKVVK